MAIRWSHRRTKVVLAAALAAGVGASVAVEAAPIIWVGGNADWIDGTSNNGNWNPADEPDPDDIAIFNTSNSVNLGSNNSIQGLTMSGGIDLNTNGFNLSVGGLVQLTGASTNLWIGGPGSVVAAQNVTAGSGGAVELTGGALNVIQSGTLSNGIITLNAGGTLAGNGTINLDAPVSIVTLLNNNGTLSALSRPAQVLLPPPPGTLTINAGSPFARIDLDGSGEAGVVNVGRNQTLKINVTLADAFNGTMNLYQDSTIDMATSWTLGAGGAIVVDNGAVAGFPGVPAGTATIAGGGLIQSGGTLTVMDSDGTLQFNSPYILNGGTFTNNGHVIFNADASIDVPIFNFSAGDWTVRNNAMFSVNVTDYAIGPVNSLYSTVTLDNGDIWVSTADAEFVMDGTLNMISTQPGQVTVWNGEPIDIGNDLGVLDAVVNVSGNQVSRFANEVDFNSDAYVTVAAGATLEFAGPVNFDTVNGASSALFTGAGAMRFDGPVNVNEAVTLSMTGGTVDLDGTDSVGDIVKVRAPLVINAATLESFGRANPGGGVNAIQIDALSPGATGALTVNLDHPDAEWTLNPQGALVLLSTNAPLTLLHGSDVNLEGSVSVTGTAGTAARVELSGTMNLLTAAPNGGLILQGGTLANPNRIANGQINGPGRIRASSGRALAGWGVINAPIDFAGTAELIAEGGMLAVNGGIEHVGTIRIKGAPAVLHFGQPFSTSVTDNGIVLSGGTLQGGMVTTSSTAKSIRGFGTVISPIVNNGAVEAQGGTLVLSNVNSDWDGSTNAGHLRATGGGTLEVHDNQHVTFGGTLFAGAGSTIALNNFDSTLTAGSSIHLTSAKLQSTNTTHIEGSVIVGAGGESSMSVQDNRFLEFHASSSTSLGSDLRLVNNNIRIGAGAIFTGPGGLILPAGSHLVAQPNANINVLLDNRGNFNPGGIDVTGRVDLRDYQQSSTGKLFVELSGLGLNQFDRVVVNGTAQLGGELNLNLDGGYVPDYLVSHTIITGLSVAGTFQKISGLEVTPTKYLAVTYTPNTVQVTAALPGDANLNGIVNLVDFNILATNFGFAGKTWASADFNGDGIVNLQDFNRLAAHFGLSASGPQVTPDDWAALAAAVPEPSAAAATALFAIAASSLRPRIRRSHPVRRGEISR